MTKMKKPSKKQGGKKVVYGVVAAGIILYLVLFLYVNSRFIIDADDVDSEPSRDLNVFDLINNGHLHLINIMPGREPFNTGKGNDAKPYYLHGKFCHLDWSLHKNDPSSVPMNKDLISKSKSCQRTQQEVDLYDAVKQARLFDGLQKKRKKPKVHSMEPTGFVFHESRVGSTLVANSLAAYNPDQNRVYSESSPPIGAAKLYTPEHEDASIQLLKDVVYLMGRTDDVKEQRLYFKIQSIGVKSIQVFRKAFPGTPWIFLYREPVQVMRSHLKTEDTKKAVCLRSKRRPDRDIIELVKGISGNEKLISDLTYEEHCAAHLATLCEAALQQARESNGKGKIVNYDGLMDELASNIIPKHFLSKGSMSKEEKDRILEVSEHYSKGRDMGRVWKEDSNEKEDTAWKELKDASDLYLRPVYNKLEAMRRGYS
mmetsp:Transcript_18109/g.22170  ORF Transcript_18109/g.22170 Transcript_18109/m.22170 type:complete len:427 (-) Transcript_18109:376-1656(-)